jgi:FKBP-type peptidyl-prolyl cis-trans isomerase (trigger factor)
MYENDDAADHDPDDDTAEAMIDTSLPKYGNGSFNKRLRALANNTGSYEDAVEDHIASDKIIQTLLKKRRQYAGDSYSEQKLAEAIRVRRSIVALLYRES